MKKSIVPLTQLALFSAIILVMTFIPYLGYITIPGALSITTLHIPVIIGAIVLSRQTYSYAWGAAIGGVWGVTCLLYALFNGTADAAIFLNPLISVVPRILVGVLIVAFYKLALSVCKTQTSGTVLTFLMAVVIATFVMLLVQNIAGSWVAAVLIGLVALAVGIFLILRNFSKIKEKNIVPILFTAVMGTFSNTVLVLIAINLFGSNGLIQLVGVVKNIFSTVIALNGTIEILAAMVIALPCALAVTKYIKK